MDFTFSIANGGQPPETSEERRAIQSRPAGAKMPSLLRRVLALSFFLVGILAPLASAQTLFVTSGDNVGSYNPTTGATNDSTFITGITAPVGILENGGNLLVSSTAGDTVGKYDLATGATVNATLVSDDSALALAISGSTLYVSHFAHSKISTFNANTGATLNGNFITTDILGVYGLAVSSAGLLASDAGYFQIRRFDLTTGAFISAFITGLNDPRGIAVSGSDLFVVNRGNNTVGKYNATTGAVINASFISSGLNSPYGVAIWDNFLYVTNHGNDTVAKFNATTGALIDGSFITGLADPSGIVISAVPEPGTYALLVVALGFALLRRRWVACQE